MTFLRIMNVSEDWIADRMHQIDASGIRKVFDLAATMKDPVNLSIGQPHYDTPQPVKDALCEAVQQGRNAYSQTQGIAPLNDVLRADLARRYGHADRDVFVTSGTSGGLLLTLCTLINPGDEVIIFDPWFVMYRHLVALAGGRVVPISTYPDFRIRIDDVRAAMTPQTRLIIFNSPANPTGVVATPEETKAIAELAAEQNIALLSDEIYSAFCYDSEFCSPAQWNDRTIVIDGFSKSHSMTGLRLGYLHAPNYLVRQMLKLQQFTFVCAPHPVQWAGLTAWELDLTGNRDDYRRRRSLLVEALDGRYEICGGEGAFYLFLRAPWGSGTQFVTEAIRRNLLIIPGSVFSAQDSHFRVSFAAEDSVLLKGAKILRELADHPPTAA